MTFKEKLLSVIDDKKQITEKGLCNAFELKTRAERDILSQTLKGLVKENVVAFIDGKYMLFEEAGYKPGKLKCFEKGFAFFIPDDGSVDLFVAPKNIGAAFQGDNVLVRRIPDTKDEAEVVKVLSRGLTTIVGEFFSELSFSFVRPDDKGYGCDIFVEKKNGGEAESGDKVVCEIISYPQGKNPVGIITQILGKPRELESEVKAAIINSGVPIGFSEDTIAECENISENIPERELAKRTDFRNLLTITIDGDTAKDFDDAISIEKTSDGFILYVHIADVSHYVVAGGAIDKDAFNRGTSVYMPEQVIPMLPEKLSNGVCSLNPDSDRLTLTAKLVYDEGGCLVDKSFYKSIIRSNYRLTYKKVQAFFDGENDGAEFSSAVDLLTNARTLKDALTARRREKGSVDLESSEANVYYDNGELIIDRRVGLESEKLIEEFMIAANVAVAEYIFYMDIPLVYRVHEKPSEEKLSAFSEFLKKVGVNVRLHEETCRPMDFQKLLDGLCESSIFGVVNNLMLRAMQKAKYSTSNVGHFGLNEQCYCHFTSPIRRYPDLTVHRVLKAVIDEKIDTEQAFSESKLQIAAKNSSVCELRADSLERAVDNIYICKFMSQFIGDFFEGIVSGVTSFGIFLRLENSAEGIIRLENLPDDSYFFDETTYTLSGKRHSFTLGNAILAKLVAADISTGKITFSYVAVQNNNAEKREKKGKRKKSPTETKRSRKTKNDKNLSDRA